LENMWEAGNVARVGFSHERPNERPRYLDEMRGQPDIMRLIGQSAAADAAISPEA